MTIVAWFLGFVSSSLCRVGEWRELTSSPILTRRVGNRGNGKINDTASTSAPVHPFPLKEKSIKGRSRLRESKSFHEIKKWLRCPRFRRVNGRQ